MPWPREAECGCVYDINWRTVRWCPRHDPAAIAARLTEESHRRGLEYRPRRREKIETQLPDGTVWYVDDDDPRERYG